MTSLLVLAALAATPSSPWADLAASDLRAIHDTLRANHPGAIDPEHPEFLRWLEAGYRTSLQQAKQARDFAGWSGAVSGYVAGFRDGHLSASPQLRVNGWRWPGFLLAFRAGRFVVADSEGEGVPPPDAALVDCDGTAADAWFQRQVLAHQSGPDLEAARLRYAPRLLVDRGDLDFAWPKRCRFEVDGTARPFELRYRDVSADTLSPRLERAAGGSKPQLGQRVLPDGGRWVSIPSFWFQGEPEAQERMKALIADAPSWRGAPYVVLDVRRNNGGSSVWGTDLLRALYGATLFERRVERDPASARQFVEWRISPGNVKYIGELEQLVTAQLGPEHPTVKDFHQLVVGSREALAKKRPFYRLPEEVAPPATGPEPESPVRAKVFLLTDGACASACLDFADQALLLPNVVQVGQPTSADSVYMEVRSVDLPSRLARLNFAIKVYRGRPRGHNQPLIPSKRYDADLADTAALERWIPGLR